MAVADTRCSEHQLDHQYMLKVSPPRFVTMAGEFRELMETVLASNPSWILARPMPLTPVPTKPCMAKTVNVNV